MAGLKALPTWQQLGPGLARPRYFPVTGDARLPTGPDLLTDSSKVPLYMTPEDPQWHYQTSVQ